MRIRFFLLSGCCLLGLAPVAAASDRSVPAFRGEVVGPVLTGGSHQTAAPGNHVVAFVRAGLGEQGRVVLGSYVQAPGTNFTPTKTHFYTPPQGAVVRTGLGLRPKEQKVFKRTLKNGDPLRVDVQAFFFDEDGNEQKMHKKIEITAEPDGS